MKCIYRGFIIGLLAFLFPLHHIGAQAPSSRPLISTGIEQIQLFDVAIKIHANGTIKTTERIVYDFGSQDRHGIYRTIPKIKENSDGKKFVLAFVGEGAVDDVGKKYNAQNTSDDSTFSLKIGDPNATITGAHAYVIPYTVMGALTYFSDHDELYWNVTGNEWTVPIKKAKATITLPVSLAKEQVTISCYTGAVESTATDCQYSHEADTVTLETQNLATLEGLTVVVGFPKNIVAVVEPREYQTFFETVVGKIVLVILILLGICWYVVAPLLIVRRWFMYGRDPKAPMGVASAWFDAPKTKTGRSLTPAEVGTLTDEHADMADVSATIVDLARRGYMKIVEVEKGTFGLERTKEQPKDDFLQVFEKTFLDGVFEDAEYVKLKGTDLSDVVEKTKTEMYKSVVAEGLFPENPRTVRTLYTVISMVSLFTGNIFLFVTSLLFGQAMPRKTDHGAQQANIAKALKNFLTSQNRQLAFQAKNQLFFEKLLPYAVAFGVEKIWADRFKDVAMKAPSWYVGYSGGRFTSDRFVRSLGSSFSSFTTAATPTRSSSGFSSGFSGGSSGGGGGGGGGGSW